MSYSRIALIFLIIFLCSCSEGRSGEDVPFRGVWDVSVSLSANGCPNDVKILEGLSYVHRIAENSDRTQFDSVILIDDNNDVFSNGNTEPTSNSFIVTGSPHSLNPFVSGTDCTETIVWSYFEITENGEDVFSNEVGRNSIIHCNPISAPETSCNVYYSGFAFRRN